ncbi:MAG: hypothetical protein C0401_12505 [Anaerolinea sp.]|nr:hypothetical protein [Anaerolinea sp.]
MPYSPDPKPEQQPVPKQPMPAIPPRPTPPTRPEPDPDIYKGGKDPGERRGPNSNLERPKSN